MQIRSISFGAVITLLLMSLIAANPAWAWGKNGHRIAGEIASQHISPQVKAIMAELFPNRTLAEISTLADFNRSNPAEFWQKQAGPYHYVTVPDGTTYLEVGAPKQGDAYTGLQMFSEWVKDPKRSLAERQTALHFIVHIVGDLHQPLHVGNGKDRGGNDVKLDFFWESSNLHRIWDSGIIDQQKLSYTEYSDWLTRKMTPQQIAQWMEPDPMVWIQESYDIRNGIYTNNESENYNYVHAHIDALNRRLSQAGIRTAAYLNQLFVQ